LHKDNYQLQCHTYQHNYIGQTDRYLQQRYGEHIKHITSNNAPVGKFTSLAPKQSRIWTHEPHHILTPLSSQKVAKELIRKFLHPLTVLHRTTSGNQFRDLWGSVMTTNYSASFLHQKPIWTYGLAIWGCTAASNLAVIQRYQAKTLRQITNAPCYVTNHTLHPDLRIPPVRTVFQELTETHHTTLKSHPNPLIATILAPPPRRWTLDENS
jgi:hypothetical protein